MYLKEGKEYACEKTRRRLARDSRILPQHYGLALSLSFSLSLFASAWLPVSSLTGDPTVSVFVYLGTSAKPGRYCSQERTRERGGTQGYVLANLPLRERRAVVDFFIPTPSTYACIRATSATGIRFSLRRETSE